MADWIALAIGVSCVIVTPGCGTDARLVEERPLIGAEPTTIDFGVGYVGYISTKALRLSNQRRGRAVVSVVDSPVDVEPKRIELDGGSTVDLELRWTPDAAGPLRGSLRLTWGDGALEVPLAGIASDPPQCGTAPACRVVRFLPGAGCVEENLPDGSECDAGRCLVDGLCVQGRCLGATRECDDEDLCTRDACDPLAGCVHLSICAGPEGGCDRLDDGSPCSTACGEGVCRGTICVVTARLREAWSFLSSDSTGRITPHQAQVGLQSGHIVSFEVGSYPETTFRAQVLASSGRLTGAFDVWKLNPAGWRDLVVGAVWFPLEERLSVLHGFDVRGDISWTLDTTALLGVPGGGQPPAYWFGGQYFDWGGRLGFHMYPNSRGRADPWVIGAWDGGSSIPRMWSIGGRTEFLYPVIADERGRIFLRLSTEVEEDLKETRIESFDASMNFQWRADPEPDETKPGTGFEYWRPIATYGGLVVLANSLVLDAETGAVRFRALPAVRYPFMAHPLATRWTFPTPLLTDREIVSMGDDAEVSATDVSTGTIRWRRRPVSDSGRLASWTSTVLTSRGKVLFATTSEVPQAGGAPYLESYLHLIDVETGDHSSCPLPPQHYWGAPIVQEGRVVLTADGEVRAFDLPGIDIAKRGWVAYGGNMARSNCPIDRAVLP